MKNNTEKNLCHQCFQHKRWPSSHIPALVSRNFLTVSPSTASSGCCPSLIYTLRHISEKLQPCEGTSSQTLSQTGLFHIRKPLLCAIMILSSPKDWVLKTFQRRQMGKSGSPTARPHIGKATTHPGPSWPVPVPLFIRSASQLKYLYLKTINLSTEGK